MRRGWRECRTTGRDERGIERAWLLPRGLGIADAGARRRRVGHHPTCTAERELSDVRLRPRTDPGCANHGKSVPVISDRTPPQQPAVDRSAPWRLQAAAILLFDPHRFGWRLACRGMVGLLLPL